MGGQANTELHRQINATIDRDPNRRTAIRRVRNIFDATPDEVRQAGEHWYDNVHEAAAKAANVTPGRTVKHAAGLVAAVSPNMDWEKNNINAFDEVSSLSGRQWQAISRSVAAGHRTDEAREALRGMSISTAPDSNLLKAHRIWDLGEDFEDVLPRNGAPKTNSFAHNIWQPHVAGPVTIDGRQADITVDAMRPWAMGRGIYSAALKTGKQTRYEAYEDHVRGATDAINRSSGTHLLPHQVQAVVWEGAKPIERGFDPNRKKADARTGQSYQRRLSAFQAGQA